MNGKVSRIQQDFTMLALLIIPVGVAVNVICGQIAALLRLPVYLDAIGTILVAMLCGPWVGAATGGLSNLAAGVINPSGLPFFVVNLSVGWAVGLLAKKKWFCGWWRCLVATGVISLLTIVVSAPIVVLLYGGITGGGTSIITAMAMAAGANIWTAFIGTEGVFTVLDRVLSLMVCKRVIGCIPPRVLIQFPLGGQYIQKETLED